MLRKIHSDIKLEHAVPIPPNSSWLKVPQATNKKNKTFLTSWRFTVFGNKGEGVPVTAKSSTQIESQADIYFS